ncbi:MAG: VacB/RNase II family 3'-5' exoribonuclease [Victivallales bacterium]|nr:VacB/RNase II family 3'-5' exoribonuclease [Victivallales bacterium]
MSLLTGNAERGMRRLELYSQLGRRIRESAFDGALKELESEGAIMKTGKGYYELAPSRELLGGIFHRNQKGFGFVALDKGGEDVFIQVDRTGGALSGDHVLVSLSDGRDSRGPSGGIVKILERAHEKMVGMLCEQDGQLQLRPLRKDLPPLLPVQGDVSCAKVGDWAEAKLQSPDYAGGLPSVELVRRLGRQGSITSDLNAICREFGIPRKYTADAEKHAAALQAVPVAREDCTDLEIFTCDPMDARDYDDAISLEPGPARGQVVLGVHIADVACLVPHNSSLDRAARGRAFTTYLPGRTIGMLPDALSSDLCSLREGVDRLAHSAFLTMEESSGRILSSRRAHTRIRSRHRLCYEQVDRVLSGESDPALDKPFCEKLRRLNELARRMRSWRSSQEHFLPLEIPEVRVLCGGAPLRVLGMQPSHAGPSSQMIEEFMLAANVRVAMELQDRHIAGLYRNHDAPTEESLHEFAQLACQVVGGKHFHLNKRGALVEYLFGLSRKNGGALLSMTFLRHLPRAVYNVENQGHFGLGKTIYCHFTSPIRRYADLLVHQQLLACDLGRKPLPVEDVRAIQENVNALEMDIDQACFAVADRLKMRYLEQHQEEGQEGFLAEICKVSAAGLGIFLPEYGLMGFVAVTALPGNAWKYDHRAGTLCNLRTRRSFSFGETMLVRMTGFDPVRGEAVFAPARMDF